MKGFLVGALVLTVLIGGGFAALLFMADAGMPEPTEVRNEVSDELRSNR